MAFSLFGKSKEIRCNYCGYSGKDFSKWDKKLNIYKCPSCGTLLDLGFTSEEQTLLANAQAMLRKQEFSDAEEMFEDILARYPDNHEAHYGCVCAKYGLKYEIDYNGERIPTCCLDSIASFKTDIHFKEALKLAPADISEWYQKQCEYVERISEKWINEAKKEKPYDIVIRQIV